MYPSFEQLDPTSKVWRWHSRIGHQGFRTLQQLSSRNGLLPEFKDEQILQFLRKDCVQCQHGDIHSHPIHKHSNPQYEAARTLGTLHIDGMGTFSLTIEGTKGKQQYRSFNGFEYVLVVTDEFTHVVWVFPLKSKDEAYDKIKALILQLQVELNLKVGRLHGDQAGEFISTKLKEFLTNNGTRLTTSESGISQHNGVAERMNRTLQSMTRIMMVHAGAPQILWDEAIQWAAHVYNSTPQKVTHWSAPFELLRPKVKCDPNKLIVWGCNVIAKHLDKNRGKFEPKGFKGIFVGFDQQTGGYRVLDIQSDTIVVTRDLNPQEDCFTHMNLFAAKFSPSNSAVDDLSGRNSFEILQEEGDEDVDPDYEPEYEFKDDVDSSSEVMQESDEDEHTITVESQNTSEPATTASDDDREELDHTFENDVDTSSEVVRESAADESTVTVESRNVPEPVATGLRRSGRVRNNPGNIMNDPRNYSQEDQEQFFRTVEEMSDNMFHNIGHEANEEIVISAIESQIITEILMAAVVKSVSGIREPTTLKEAMNIDPEKWKPAFDDEVKSLTDRKVFTLVKLPKGKKAISTRWVTKIKLDENNQPIRWKARFVVRGFSQIPGVDYNLTQSPVASWKSIRMIMSITAREDHELFQYDYDTAFLNAQLEEDIYVQQPEGYHVGGPDMVWKLNKAMYGLKQASREWNKTADSFMKRLGFKPLVSDPCVYMKQSKTNRLILIGLYVDDTIISVHRDDIAEWESYKKKINETFTIKDLGECKWILNIKVTRDRKNKTITLSQQAYTERIAAEHGLSQTRTVTTPIRIEDLYPSETEQSAILNEENKKKYQSIVGELLYAANITRPDTSFSVGRLCQRLSNPCEHHLSAAQRILRYLNQTSNYSLKFGGQGLDLNTSGISAFSDSDWAECKETRRSTSGCLVVYNGDVVHWFSRRQKAVTTSSAEAEYVALFEASKEILWFRNWLSEVFGEIKTGTLIHEDNQAAIELAENPNMMSQRVKHIDLKYHFLRELVAEGKIRLGWIQSENQLADILTKPLQGSKFMNICQMIMQCV